MRGTATSIPPRRVWRERRSSEIRAQELAGEERAEAEHRAGAACDRGARRAKRDQLFRELAHGELQHAGTDDRAVHVLSLVQPGEERGRLAPGVEDVALADELFAGQVVVAGSGGEPHLVDHAQGAAGPGT